MSRRREKQQVRTDARREVSIPYRQAGTVAALSAVLLGLPPEAKIYGDDQGRIVVWQGHKTLAYVDMTGY